MQPLLFPQDQAFWPERLFARLTAAKTLLAFTEAEGAGDHCQAGAVDLAGARIFDWLDETLG